MSASGEIAGQWFVVELPVLLSDNARRQILVETGVTAAAEQVLRIEDLTEVPRELRDRVVDLTERVRIDSWEEPVGDGSSEYEHVVRVVAYELLRRDGRSWSIWDLAGERLAMNQLFWPSAGRTLTFAEHIRRGHPEEEIDALLAGKPLVTQLSGEAHLSLETVLDAYDATVELARQVCDRAWLCERFAEDDLFWPPYLLTSDEMILLVPAPTDQTEAEPDPLGILRASDAKTFDAALEIVREMNELPASAETRFANQACKTAENLRRGLRPAATDAQILDLAIKPAANAARQAVQHQVAAEVDQASYEQQRSDWIARSGSKRLRLAAERGYRHDGLYRDERLTAELPGFTGVIGRRSEIKEIVNPSEAALDMESETLQRVEQLGLSDVSVRLVFLKADVDLAISGKLQDGEYVEIDNYLGRHKVYRPVRPLTSDDDIPF